jgi:hypothetical protein
MEHTPLLREEAGKPNAVYGTRWWLLLVLSAMTFAQVWAHEARVTLDDTQGWIWNDWGPIAQSAKAVYGWTDGTIALLANWVGSLRSLPLPQPQPQPLLLSLPLPPPSFPRSVSLSLKHRVITLFRPQLSMAPSHMQGPICFFIAVIPSSWLMDTKGSV